MTNRYYYFAASLPHLSTSKDPPINGQRFLELCDRYLSPEQLQIMHAIHWNSTNITTDSRPLIVWQRFELDLRHQLAFLRSERASTPTTERHQPYVADLVRTAFESKDPLSIEHALFRLRWNRLNHLDQDCFMDIGSLFVYKLKLDLLERRAAMNHDDGWKALCELRAATPKIASRISMDAML